MMTDSAQWACSVQGDVSVGHLGPGPQAVDGKRGLVICGPGMEMV